MSTSGLGEGFKGGAQEHRKEWPPKATGGRGKVCQQANAALPTAPPSTSSTGGNAGMAAAYAARKLGVPATIVLPEGTSLQVVRRLEGQGAEVQLTGKVRTLGRGSRLEWAAPPSPPLPCEILSPLPLDELCLGPVFP